MKFEAELAEIASLTFRHCFDYQESRKAINESVKKHDSHLVEALNFAWRNRLISISVNGGYFMTRKYYRIYYPEERRLNKK